MHFSMFRGAQSRTPLCTQATVASLTGHEGAVQAFVDSAVRTSTNFANRRYVQTLSFSGNGYYLASGSSDGVVKYEAQLQVCVR